jgi:hypothetical protein
MKYSKKTPRINVKFINGDSDEILFEVNDRTNIDVGNMFINQYVDELVKNEFKDKRLPKNIMVLAVAEFELK